jgi:hypothetical protein
MNPCSYLCVIDRRIFFCDDRCTPARGNTVDNGLFAYKGCAEPVVYEPIAALLWFQRAILEHITPASLSSSSDGDASAYSSTEPQAAKASYLLRAHCDCLETVRWHHIQDDCHRIRSREGHLACRLGDDWIVTGGFLRDTTVFIKRPGDYNHWIRRVPPQPPVWVYGASLTALPDGHRAVRFGGFASGGYADETNHVSI